MAVAPLALSRLPSQEVRSSGRRCPRPAVTPDVALAHTGLHTLEVHAGTSDILVFPGSRSLVYNFHRVENI